MIFSPPFQWFSLPQRYPEHPKHNPQTMVSIQSLENVSCQLILPISNIAVPLLRNANLVLWYYSSRLQTRAFGKFIYNETKKMLEILSRSDCTHWKNNQSYCFSSKTQIALTLPKHNAYGSFTTSAQIVFLPV